MSPQNRRVFLNQLAATSLASMGSVSRVAADSELADSQLWHAIRRADGTWTKFGGLDGQINIGLAKKYGSDAWPQELAASVVNGELFMMATFGGHAPSAVYFTIRRTNGIWTHIDQVTKEFHRSNDVGVTALNGRIQVCSANRPDTFQETERAEDGEWMPYKTIVEFFGVQSMLDCAAVKDDLHLCLAQQEKKNRLWHSIRQPGKAWSPLGDLSNLVGGKREFRDVGCASVNGELHVCAVSLDGLLLHTIRHANGSWEPFGDVEKQAGNRDDFIRASAADVGGQLHLCATDGRFLWHTVRHQNGTWTQFGNVGSAAGNVGFFKRTAISSDGQNLHVCAITG